MKNNSVNVFGYVRVSTEGQPQVLKTIFGHSNISMTMDLYSHVLGDEKVQEMILLENLF